MEQARIAEQEKQEEIAMEQMMKEGIIRRGNMFQKSINESIINVTNMILKKMTMESRHNINSHHII